MRSVEGQGHAPLPSSKIISIWLDLSSPFFHGPLASNMPPFADKALKRTASAQAKFTSPPAEAAGAAPFPGEVVAGNVPEPAGATETGHAQDLRLVRVGKCTNSPEGRNIIPGKSLDSLVSMWLYFWLNKRKLASMEAG